MLILHTSDWHLGRTLHQADLTPAFQLWCDHVVDLVEERGIDAVLISGDIYDRAIPPTHVVSLFNSTLERLTALTTVVLTSGNHDSPGRLGFGASLMKDSLHIRTDARESGTPIPLRNKAGDVEALVYAMPYLDPDVERRNLAPHSPGQDPIPEDYLERSHEEFLQRPLRRLPRIAFPAPTPIPLSLASVWLTPLSRVVTLPRRSAIFMWEAWITPHQDCSGWAPKAPIPGLFLMWRWAIFTLPRKLDSRTIPS